MEAEKLKELICFNDEHERYVALPNNLFDKLLALVEKKELKSQHVGYAFSYLYLQTYMFRYTKYDKFIPTAGEIKEILGYSQTNKTLDYITKRNGLLDEHKITETSNDFVLVSEFESDILTFTYASNLGGIEWYRKHYNVGLSQTYKIPIFGFHTNPDDYEDFIEPHDGTFYEFNDDTSDSYTLIDFEVFAYMMANKELGVNAFYLYCYLLHKNNTLFESYDASTKRLSDETGLSSKTVQRYRDNMRAFNVMTLVHQMDHFVIGLNNKYERKASSNLTHRFENFTMEETTYNKQTKIDYKAYKKMRNEPYIDNTSLLEFEESELPF